MYFIDLNGLKDQWKNGAFTDQHAIQYVLGGGVLMAFWNLVQHFLKQFSQQGLYQPNMAASGAVLVGTGIGSAIGIGLFSWLTITIYRANGGENGRHLLNKSVSIGFVLAIRFSLLLFVPTLNFVLFPTSVSMSIVNMLFLIGALIWNIRTTLQTLREIHSHELATQPAAP